jgi:hypothetical protein
MDPAQNDHLEQLDRHLATANQSWLLGAGISKNGNIPLMIPLTERVVTLAKDSPHQPLLDALKAELPESAHVEHLLSHLGDYATLAERSRTQATRIGERDMSLDDLVQAHRQLLHYIATTVRWGFRPDTQEAGKVGNAITNIAEHSEFVAALFGTAQAGLKDRRGPINTVHHQLRHPP